MIKMGIEKYSNLDEVKILENLPEYLELFAGISDTINRAASNGVESLLFSTSGSVMNCFVDITVHLMRAYGYKFTGSFYENYLKALPEVIALIDQLIMDKRDHNYISIKLSFEEDYKVIFDFGIENKTGKLVVIENR